MPLCTNSTSTSLADDPLPFRSGSVKSQPPAFSTGDDRAKHFSRIDALETWFGDLALTESHHSGRHPEPKFARAFLQIPPNYGLASASSSPRAE